MKKIAFCKPKKVYVRNGRFFENWFLVTLLITRVITFVTLLISNARVTKITRLYVTKPAQLGPDHLVSDYENVGEVTMAVQEEIKVMERRLKKMEALEAKAVEKECLVTRTVELAEVRQDLEGWRDAISKEYESLLQHRAIQPIGGAEFEELKNSNKQLEIIPAKLVATVKPPHRRKARVVGCGNQAQWVEEDVTAGGIDTIAVRAIVSGAASNGWKISVADFKTAFLQAPRRDVGNKCTIVTPPQVLRDLKLMEYGDQERWVVKGALYSLAESPKDWACFKDARMRTMRWSDEEGHSWMESTPEAHVWKVKKSVNHQDVDKKESAEKEEGEVVAIIGVYVDDLIISAKEEEMQRILQEFAKNFNMAEPEMVNGERTVSFCGYELKEVNSGFEVGQTKYATEMVKRRNVEGIENIPCPKLEEGVDEEVDMMDLREAQQLTGELSWLASRSRPDLMYTVGAMSRLLHRRPKYVCKLGWWAMRYIAGTCNRVLRFEAVPESEKNDLVVAVDTSYAPPHENYKSIQGMMITHGKNAIMWSSTRQPFVAQSTCEADRVQWVRAKCGIPVRVDEHWAIRWRRRSWETQKLGYHNWQVMEDPGVRAICASEVRSCANFYNMAREIGALNIAKAIHWSPTGWQRPFRGQSLQATYQCWEWLCKKKCQRMRRQGQAFDQWRSEWSLTSRRWRWVLAWLWS